MRDVTLCLLVKEKELLLAMKKRGFGAGRWNGVGGKLREGESIEEAALREMKEEIGVDSEIANLEKVAILDFYFRHKPEWNQRVHIFFVKQWNGEPQESEEMKPKWYSHSEIPFSDMWPDDVHWLPRVLQGEKIRGEFHFADTGNTFDSFDLKPVEEV